MPRTVVELLPHDLAVKTALETVGKPVGFGTAPAGTLDSSGRPVADYFVFHRVSGQRDGSIADPYADAHLTYQVNAVCRMPEACADLIAEAEAALLGTVIAGRVVAQVEPVAEQGPQADRDVGPPHPFWAFQQIRLHTVPA